MQHDDLRTQWLKRAETALKGQSFDAEALQGRIVGPRAFRAEHSPWKAFARIDHTIRNKAKAQAEDDLSHGVDGLIVTSAEVTAVLDDLPLHQFALRNEAGDQGAEAIRMAVSRQPVDPARLQIDFALADAAFVKPLLAQGFAGPFMKADGRMAHAEGMDNVQELGVVLADAIAKLRKLEHLNATVLSRAVSVTLSASQQMFETMAKFRAARILWARVLEASGLPDTPLALHGETSRVMYSDTDAHTNILRAVTAVFGAGLGGADSMCALPFSFNQGLPNGFARRVARNVQSLLLHESHLWRVADPAAGAGAIEKRTAALCNEAWEVMQACEKGQKPSPRGTMAAPIIGVTKFPGPKTHAPEVEAQS